MTQDPWTEFLTPPTPRRTKAMRDQTRKQIVRVGVFAADQWALDHLADGGPMADFTRGLVETAVLHLIEQGLLLVPDDIQRRLREPIPVRREVTDA